MQADIHTKAQTKRGFTAALITMTFSEQHPRSLWSHERDHITVILVQSHYRLVQQQLIPPFFFPMYSTPWFFNQSSLDSEVKGSFRPVLDVLAFLEGVIFLSVIK